MSRTTRPHAASDPWRVVTWAGNRDAQLESTLAATPAQRLAWLEEALIAAYQSGALPDPDVPSGTGKPDGA